MTAAEAMLEARRRNQAGEPFDGLFSPDCAIGGHAIGMAAPRGSGFADQLAASDEQRYAYVLRDILEDRGDWALFRAVWTHRDRTATGGSAGLFFGICTVAGELIVRMDVFPTEVEARAALDG